MALFIITVSLRVAAVAVAAIPLVVLSHKHHRQSASARREWPEPGGRRTLQ